MRFDIWASAEGETPDPADGDTKHHVERYTTREGAVAKARTLLRQGRSVEIIPVSDTAPLPGGGVGRSAGHPAVPAAC